MLESSAQPLKRAVQVNGPDWVRSFGERLVWIGRDSSCDVVINDPLVSREHARLSIDADKVVIEDCRSANGVYVNNIRIFEPYRLCDGDRLLLGTTELSLSAAELPLEEHDPRSAGAQPLPPVAQGIGAGPTTRAAALQVLGSLADLRLSEGRAKDAERVLADHLMRILDGARVGLTVPEPTCRDASQYALKLAAALRVAKWVDYVLELHLCIESPITSETLRALGTISELLQQADPDLYGQYLGWLRATARSPSGRELQLAERLEALGPRAEDSRKP